MLTYDELSCIANHCDIPTFSALERAAYCKFKPSQRHDTIRLLEKHLNEVIGQSVRYRAWYGGYSESDRCRSIWEDLRYINPWKEHCKWRLRRMRRHRQKKPDHECDAESCGINCRTLWYELRW
jgi:hypothetical protein